MKKVFSLVRASMSEGMNLFILNTKKKSVFSKFLLPIILIFIMMGVMYVYSELIIKQLIGVGMGFVLLSLFIIVTSVMTLVEGIYKSSNLIFNCKDDDLLLSLPIRKSTVLFVRVFKFYMFELLYNSLFLLPAMVVYAKYMNPEISYYIVSLIGLLMFPIIPILVSCLIGLFISYFVSRFKFKSFAQTIVTIIFLLGIMFFSYSSENLVMSIAKNASGINALITKFYYPASIYIKLVLNFNIIDLFKFMFFNLSLFVITILFLGKIYFSINSNVKAVKFSNSSKRYVVKSSSPVMALIKKEFSRFINSSVFVTNAGFGLVLFILICVLSVIKFDDVVNMIVKFDFSMTPSYIRSIMPLILFAFIIFTSFMTSITSSMISLEGKSFNVLKSLPLSPKKIVNSKVLCSLVIMMPCIFIGDIIVFLRFGFNFTSIFLILVASILFPLVSETLGIIINLKYPRMDAKSDTEVVKQSMSSMLSVFIGMVFTGISLFLIFKLLDCGFTNNIIMLILVIMYAIIYLGLVLYLNRTCEKSFDNIIC